MALLFAANSGKIFYIMMYIALLCLLICYSVVAQPAGWRMIDRFYGFRYEISPKQQDASFMNAVVYQADQFGCFGWIQHTETGNFVGEGRCNKVKGPMFQEWLSKHEIVKDIAVKVYEDTKIRLHFSHFKILDPTRDTCFIDVPHQCSDLTVQPEPMEDRMDDANVLQHGSAQKRSGPTGNEL